MQSYIVYDFDNTIYNGDSSVNFFKFCLIHYPRCLLCVSVLVLSFIKYGIKKIDKTALKEAYFSFLRYVPDVDAAVTVFWKKNRRKIKQMYSPNKAAYIVIISASPEFLLEPLCKSLGASFLIASIVDPHTGKFLSKNCRGEEKCRRFSELLGNCSIQEFYSDSLSDAPLAAMADKAYLVRGNKITKWEDCERYEFK